MACDDIDLTLEWLRTPKVKDEVHGGWTIDDDTGMEIVLVFGFSPAIKDETWEESAEDYWYNVWSWLHERFVGCWQADEFPYEWHTDPDHEADMEILTAVHKWQETWRRKLHA